MPHRRSSSWQRWHNRATLSYLRSNSFQNHRRTTIIGAGAQAVTQLHTVAELFDIRKVCIYDVDKSATASFVNRTRFLNIPIQVMSDDHLDELVGTADILCTATSTAVESPPVFTDTPTKPWLHINVIGSDFPGKTELPLPLVKRAVGDVLAFPLWSMSWRA
jgi:ornithine cyclodeaminase/alanine dehydrogenase-like protein (mu-crystallin family)